MYGDTQAIRARARDLRRLADEIRWEGDTLRIRAGSVIWEGLAADAMRALATRRGSELRRVADLFDAAAAALDHHADAVETVKAVIDRIERRVRDLVSAARERLGALAGLVATAGEALGAITPDPLDEMLDRFVPPPPGHRDWLTVNFPGIDLPGLPDLDDLRGACAA
jgi:NAD(P)-dependent dehydrogenase (short-subunit alcohol dehydrogenase family)